MIKISDLYNVTNVTHTHTHTHTHKTKIKINKNPMAFEKGITNHKNP